jgi:hypothetical protein
MRSVSSGVRACPVVYTCLLFVYPPVSGPVVSHLGLNNKRQLGGFPQLTNAGEYHYNPNCAGTSTTSSSWTPRFQFTITRTGRQNRKSIHLQLDYNHNKPQPPLCVYISRPVGPSITHHATPQCALPTTSQSSSSSDATPDRAVPPPSTRPFVVCTREMLAKEKLNVHRPHEGGSKHCN